MTKLRQSPLWARRRTFASAWLALLAGMLAWPASAARAEQTAGVNEARQALQREGFPWYDKNDDSLRPVRVSVPWNMGNMPKLNGPGWPITVWELLAIIVIGGLLLAFVWLLVRAYLNREEREAAGDAMRVRHTAVDDAARIEALPFRIRRGDFDLLAEARRLSEEGKFGEAVVYLFSYQLVEMDRRQVIRLAKGRTNRQYLRDLRRQPLLRQLIERSMVAFEEVFFGGHVLDRSRFEGLWRQLEQFKALLGQSERA